jgi:hypothetical protein
MKFPAPLQPLSAGDRHKVFDRAILDTLVLLHYIQEIADLAISVDMGDNVKLDLTM